MNLLLSTLKLLTVITLTWGYDTSNSDYISIPEVTSYNDQSALNIKSNLQSTQYQDFIHQLYRFDNDNLKRVDNLFTNYEHQTQQSQQQPQQSNPEPSSDTSYNYNANQPHSRRRRDAAFRPLFVYRGFAARARQREEDRIRRRNFIARTSSKKYQAPYAYNRFEES